MLVADELVVMDVDVELLVTGVVVVDSGMFVVVVVGEVSVVVDVVFGVEIELEINPEELGFRVTNILETVEVVEVSDVILPSVSVLLTVKLIVLSISSPIAVEVLVLLPAVCKVVDIAEMEQEGAQVTLSSPITVGTGSVDFNTVGIVSTTVNVVPLKTTSITVAVIRGAEIVIVTNFVSSIVTFLGSAATVSRIVTVVKFTPYCTCVTVSVVLLTDFGGDFMVAIAVTVFIPVIVTVFWAVIVWTGWVCVCICVSLSRL